MNERPDHPGVRVPPPLVYAGAVVAGWLLDRPWPLPMGGGASRVAVAWILVAAWALLGAGSIGLFLQKHTSVLPFRPASTLVTSGPYRLTRNPMYVALTLLAVAFALFLNTWWPVLLLIPTVWVVQRFVILPEEQYLRRRFGAEYEEYARRVRRWV